MGKLIFFNFILIGIITLGLWLIKKFVKRELAKNIILISAAVFTILVHYSSFLFLFTLVETAVIILIHHCKLMYAVWMLTKPLFIVVMTACSALIVLVLKPPSKNNH